MDIDSFVKQFPRLYHFGPIKNRDSVEKLECILSSDLLRALATHPQTNERRRGRHQIKSLLFDAELNDQDALKYGHVKHQNSMTETEFVSLLDQFCYFWPGDDNGPIDMGRNFVGRYQQKDDSLFAIVVPTRDFLRANHTRRIALSNCNSGAPRSNPNAVIYRGDDTFVPWKDYQGNVANVKEVAVLGYAKLPGSRFLNNLSWEA
jgi:hypothetical protein